MPQLFDVIFSDLRSSKKSVNRLLSIGILFALLGHFFVVEPFFPYKAQEHEQTKLRDNAKAIRQSILNSLDAIEFQIETYPAHLGQVRQKIYDAIVLEGSSEPLPVGKITIPAKTKFEDGMRYYVENWFSNLLDKLNNEIVIKVSDLLDKLNKEIVIKVSELKSGDAGLETFIQEIEIETKRAPERFRAGLDRLKTDNPMIFFDYKGNKGAEATAMLQQNLEDALAPVKFNVTVLLKRTEERLTEINEDINELEARIGTLESPLGPIPVGLTDFVILFPLVIVTLVVMGTVALHKSCRMFTVYRREFATGDAPTDSETYHQLADCWYLPPYSSVFPPLLLIALSVVITGLFVRDSLLVILTDHAKLFTFLFPAGESSTKSVFTGLYIFGTFVVVGCFGLIFKTLRRIKQEVIE